MENWWLKIKKGGGHQSAPNVPDCLIELFPDIGIDKQASARLSINHHKSCFYCRSPNAGKWAIEHTWSRVSPGWTPGWQLGRARPVTVSRPLRKSTLSIASNLFVADQILVALRDILSAITRYHRARIDSHYALLYCIGSDLDWLKSCHVLPGQDVGHNVQLLFHVMCLWTWEPCTMNMSSTQISHFFSFAFFVFFSNGKSRAMISRQRCSFFIHHCVAELIKDYRMGGGGNGFLTHCIMHFNVVCDFVILLKHGLVEVWSAPDKYQRTSNSITENGIVWN